MTDRADTGARERRVDERIHAIERLGQHGRMPNYWREPLFLALTADDVAASALAAGVGVPPDKESSVSALDQRTVESRGETEA